MKASTIILAGTVVFLIILVGQTDAGPVIASFTFEADQLGSMPAGWSAGSYDGFLIDAYVTDTTAGSGSRSFYMNDYKYPSQISMRASLGSTYKSGVYQLTGKARVEQNNQSVSPFTLLG